MPVTFTRRLWQYDGSLISKRLAARDGLAVAAALFAGLHAGGPQIGVPMAVGALTTGLADGPGPVRIRISRVGVAALLMALSAFAGSATGSAWWLAVPAIALWSLGGGLAGVLGPNATIVGLTSIVVLVVMGEAPLDLPHALGLAALVLAGGAFALAASAVALPSRTLPQRRAVAEVYAQLARLTTAAVAHGAVPPPLDAIGEAAALLRALGSRTGSADEGLRTLVDVAERVRVAVLALEGWRGDEPAVPAHAASPSRTADGVAASGTPVDDALARTREALDELAAALTAGREPHGLRAAADAVLATAARSEPARPGAAAAPRAHAIARTLEALAGQLRAAELAAHDAVAGAGRVRALGRALRPPAPQLRTALATLRANLTLRSTAFRHALRLCACLVTAEAIVRATGLPRGYWVVMTAALVLKPDFNETFARGLMRTGGTLVGVALAMGLDRLVHGAEAGRIALVFLGALGVRSIGRSHYGLLTASVSIVVVELLAFVGEPVATTIEERLLATLIGGALALVFYLAWPTWERRHVASVLATLVDAYRAYWDAIVARAVRGEPVPASSRLAELRLAARLARTNAEASVDRARGEPARSQARVDRAAGVLAAAHRFVLAGLRLEALAGALAAPGLEPLRGGIDATLAAIVATLRERAPLGDLPDLRAAQLRVERDASDAAMRYFASEADVAVDALDTIVELLHADAAARTSHERERRTRRPRLVQRFMPRPRSPARRTRGEDER